MLPFFKNYYAGGVSSVRGYKPNSLGPRDSNDDPLGGSKRVVLNAELLFPFPGLPNDRSVRMSTFVDSGMVGEKYDSTWWRSSVGVGVLWVSPLGPLRIFASQPFGDKSGDRKERFQFTFGAAF